MDTILTARTELYNQFHGSRAGDDHFFKNDHAEHYGVYYTAMYLIQDTGEAVQSHKNRGFSSNPWLAYIEFWGVMQAIFIQQDAIGEIYKVIIGSRLIMPKESAWWRIRDVRNLCTGHPAKRDRDVPHTQRTFMARDFGTYECIKYELWDASSPDLPSHPTFNLSKMVEDYDVEGAEKLKEICVAMAARWPRRA